ncbi:peptide deformylase [Roseomonas genomospecies 6]|uniref:Peptide deformylase n=1 Tax=Roseomonas genomospecies 6 TaxID=214106 RepID=A0A9W7TZ63_9PROT|nr:peptide deformylase [Roseomonas genomospecies 6]KAA0681021.1 peptide deformylase [Roseomonas genomospecies 6]
MALLKIARMGHPVLRKVAAPVPDPTAPEIRRLASDMIDTMLDAPGVGLAAPQVHESLRMIVFRVPGERSGGESVGPTVLINPVVEPLGDALVTGLEGCLSIPELRGIVPRFVRIRYRGVGLDGEPIEREAEGFHARVIQHECDHLDGVLYIDRMTDLRYLAFKDEAHHVAEALDQQEGRD